MYRWNTLAFVAIALTLQASNVKAERCHQAQQQDLLCFTPLNVKHESSSASGNNPLSSSAAFWGSATTISDVTPVDSLDRPLPENAGITSRTDAWGKTTYYNLHGLAIGSSTKDIAGKVHYRDQNGGEVERLW